MFYSRAACLLSASAGLVTWRLYLKRHEKSRELWEVYAHTHYKKDGCQLLCLYLWDFSLKEWGHPSLPSDLEPIWKKWREHYPISPLRLFISGFRLLVLKTCSISPWSLRFAGWGLFELKSKTLAGKTVPCPICFGSLGLSQNITKGLIGLQRETYGHQVVRAESHTSPFHCLL